MGFNASKQIMGKVNINSSQHDWIAICASVPGRKHLRAGIPCQDASVSESGMYPFLAVADGRGSASHSELGANSACQAIADIVKSSGGLLSTLLDNADTEAAEKILPSIQDLLLKSVTVKQEKLAAYENVGSKDLEHTLLVVIIGASRCLYMHVGDGAIVVQNGSNVYTISKGQRGEYANVTCFVGADTRPEQVHVGLLETKDLRGISAMSDGTAERLVHSQTGEPAPGMAQIFQQAREGCFGRKELLRFLTESFWEPHVQDDRSLAVLVRNDTNSETVTISTGALGDYGKKANRHTTSSENEDDNTSIKGTHSLTESSDLVIPQGQSLIRVTGGVAIICLLLVFTGGVATGIIVNGVTNKAILGNGWFASPSQAPVILDPATHHQPDASLPQPIFETDDGAPSFLSRDKTELFQPPSGNTESVESEDTQ